MIFLNNEVFISTRNLILWVKFVEKGRNQKGRK